MYRVLDWQVQDKQFCWVVNVCFIDHIKLGAVWIVIDSVAVLVTENVQHKSRTTSAVSITWLTKHNEERHKRETLVENNSFNYFLNYSFLHVSTQSLKSYWSCFFLLVYIHNPYLKHRHLSKFEVGKTLKHFFFSIHSTRK